MHFPWLDILGITNSVPPSAHTTFSPARMKKRKGRRKFSSEVGRKILELESLGGNNVGLMNQEDLMTRELSMED